MRRAIGELLVCPFCLAQWVATAALAGFDIERYRPALVCIEAHEEVRRRVLDYFAGHGYRRVEAYDGLDPLNYYFTPQNPGSPGLDGSGRTRRRP